MMNHTAAGIDSSVPTARTTHRAASGSSESNPASPASADSVLTERSSSAATARSPCVYFDGACPLCSKEIAAYRAARGGDQLQWVDANGCDEAALGPALNRSDALARLHVRLADGTLLSGAAAFVAIWQRLPAFRALAWLARLPGALLVMEGAYRAFLRVRPVWRAAPAPSQPPLTRSQAQPQTLPHSKAPTQPSSPSGSASFEDGLATAWPSWPIELRRELRTDHAGEAGAVMIYRGILAVTRDPQVREFAQHHLQTEARHLELIEAVVPPAGRSRLLPLWRVAGWLTGALPACCGAKAVYATIESVETFVDQHYAAQLRLIDALTDAPPKPRSDERSAAPTDSQTTGSSAPGAVSGPRPTPALSALRALLADCQQDELVHRDDARARRQSTEADLHAPPSNRSAQPRTSAPSLRGRVAQGLQGAWTALVASGSASAVRVSRWI